MNGSPGGRRGAQPTSDARYGRSLDEIERERGEAEAAGREAWNEGTRTGRPVMARTPAELEALGRQRLAQKAVSGVREAGLQANAAVRGAADSISLGSADEIAAAADALLGIGPSGNLRQRYEANLLRQHEIDRYDAAHRGTARTAGQYAGMALLGLGGARAGAGYSNSLSPRAKGTLGEVMSAGKTILRGDLPVGFQKRVPLSKSYTVADQLTARGAVVESKFGRTARLSAAQRRAERELANYRVDRWLPLHVGRITGGASAGSGWLAGDDDDR